MRTRIFAIGLVVVVAISAGCAERKMTVTSDPPGAVVFLDGTGKGVTPVTFKFNWYGGRRFLLRRDGYRICEEIRQVKAPLHMKFPLDAIWDLTPLPATDHKKFHFKLVKETAVDVDALKVRAERMRRQAHEDAELRLKKLDREPASSGQPAVPAEPGAKSGVRPEATPEEQPAADKSLSE